MPTKKLTHRDQYLNFHSNHHLQHKRAVVNTLLLQAKTLVSKEDDGKREIQHVKQALKTNNYPDWMLTIRNNDSDTREFEESRNEKRVYASVPYIKGISERLQTGAPNDNFRENICSEDDLRSRIFGTFVVKFLACLPLLGFSNI